MMKDIGTDLRMARVAFAPVAILCTCFLVMMKVADGLFLQAPHPGLVGGASGAGYCASSALVDDAIGAAGYYHRSRWTMRAKGFGQHISLPDGKVKVSSSRKAQGTPRLLAVKDSHSPWGQKFSASCFFLPTHIWTFPYESAGCHALNRSVQRTCSLNTF